MPATTPPPDHLSAPGPDGPSLAADAPLAEEAWLDQPPEPPSWLADYPEPEDPEWVDAWLERELAAAAPWLAADPWLTDDPDWDNPGGHDPGRQVPGPHRRITDSGEPVEVLKAGRWDRTRGNGGGFAAGGLADHLSPGPVLAGLAGDRWQAGLGRLSDDELIGVMRAARRLASWAAAMELAAVDDLWQRRTREEDAGDTGAALHADAEIAAALTLTRRAADRLLNLAAALHRLPATRTALAAGDIDLPRAQVIADELTGLTDRHAAAVEATIIGAAPGQTTGQLRCATRRAVLTVDPDAARRRKEQALREARVERWTEPAGTAALAGRDLPPAGVLAADANLTALAKQLQAAGAEGTLDTVRAQIYLALLTGTPATALLPAGASKDLPDGTSPGGPASDRAGDGSSGTTKADRDQPTDNRDQPHPGPGWPGLGRTVVGRVNLTVPLATWLGYSSAPGHVPGYGPLDASDSRTLAATLAAQAGTKWCLTFTGPDGRPLAHGCARTGPPFSQRRADPGARPRAGPQSGAGPPPGPDPRSTAVLGPWTFTIMALTGGCDHALETPAYRPTPALRHLVNLRHTTCVFPGCRRPATQCDADHTIPYDDGGKTCLCNLAPLCRHHHQVKQNPGWTLEQTTPGTLIWTTPAGRRYPA